MPCIEVRPEPSHGFGGDGDDVLASLIEFLAAPRHRSDQRIAGVISGLIEEGRRFRKTESGTRWSAVLANSKLVANGWMLWNMLDLDRFAKAGGMPAEGDTPAALLEDLVRKLGDMRLEQLIALLSAYGIDKDSNERDAT